MLNQLQKNRGGALFVFFRCFGTCAKGVKPGKKLACVAIGKDNVAGMAEVS